MISKKLVIIGDSSVGKTSILERFVFDKFKAETESMPTVSGAFKNKVVDIEQSNGEKGQIKLAIWDTAGQEKFESLTKLYFSGASAAFIVYDVTDSMSFEKARKWANDVDQTSERSGTSIIKFLVGNKIDKME